MWRFPRVLYDLRNNTVWGCESVSQDAWHASDQSKFQGLASAWHGLGIMLMALLASCNLPHIPSFILCRLQSHEAQHVPFTSNK